MIAAGRAAITAARVKMREMFSGASDGIALGFLLDVHVERVEMKFQRRTLHRANHLQRLFGGVDKVGFKTVQRFETNLFAVQFGAFAQRLEMLHHGRPLFFVFILRHGIRATYGGINWSDKRRAIQHHHLSKHSRHVI